jgi:hypothetical protein
MAKRKVTPRRSAAPRLPLKPSAQAAGDADSIRCELDGIKRLTAFLGDFDSGSTSMQIPEQTKEWLRGILYDWIRDTAADLEVRAERVLTFLNEQEPKAEVA